MRKDLQTWLVDHDITGPPPSAEAEQRAMWSWIRDFHKEYNDDWYARNMPRLRDQFRPIFMQEIKSMKAKAGQSESTPIAANDLLDFGGSQPSKEATPKAVSSASNGEQDLLGFDAPSGGSASLLDVQKASNDLANGADPFAPATTTSADHGVLDILAGSASSTSDRELSGLKGTAVEALGNDLLNVDLGGYSAQPAVPLAPQAVQQMSVQPQASPEEKLSQLQQQLAQPSFSNPQPQQPLTQQLQFQQLQQELQHTALQQQQIQFQALQHELKQPDPQQLQMQDASFSLLTDLSPAPGGSGKGQAKKEDNLFDFNLM